MDLALITIILPVRNGGDYLFMAVESVLDQTDADWRLIILENQSDDGTPAYLASLTDPRISVFSAEQSLSIEDNWGRIKDLPVCGWATFLGHDDLLAPDFVAGAKRDIRQNPDASLWMSHFELIDASGTLIRKCRPMPWRESGTDFLRERWRHRRDSYGTGYVFRFADYVACGGIPDFPGLLYADDYVWYALASRSGCYCSPRTGFSYRAHAQSAARQSHPQLALDGACHFLGRLTQDAAADLPLAQFLSHMGRRFAEHIELCYWKGVAQSARSAPADVALPSRWLEQRNCWPVRCNALKFLLLRHWWTCHVFLQKLASAGP